VNGGKALTGRGAMPRPVFFLLSRKKYFEFHGIKQICHVQQDYSRIRARCRAHDATNPEKNFFKKRV
jgi:hypothetical protein